MVSLCDTIHRPTWRFVLVYGMPRLVYKFQGPGGYSSGYGTYTGGGFDAYQPFKRYWLQEQIRGARRAREAVRAASITASRELPGRTHWDPSAADAVGSKGGGPSSDARVVFAPGGSLPQVGVFLPDFRNEGQPPIIYNPPPIVLPGQTDPGREEQETQEGDVAHTWTHVGSQFIGALFPSSAPQQAFVAGPSTGFNLGPPAPVTTPPAAGAVMTPYSGSCPPAKTRTLTIDCATGLEVKRKRRRRRALLTQGDMGVLFQIAALPSNQNVRIALAGAVRR